MKATLCIIALVVMGAAAWFGLSRFGGNPQSGGAGTGPEKRIEDFRPARLAPFDPEKIEMDAALGSEVIRDQILVTMHDGRTQENLETILGTVAPAARVIGVVPAVDMYQVEIPADAKVAACQRLENHPWIVSATLNFVRRSQRTFNDPFLADSEKGWGIARINGPEAWDGTTGKDTTIAIVDSGTLVTHEEFQGKVVNPFSYATGSETMEVREYLEAFQDADGNLVYVPSRVAGHGTHVAGTASAKADNSKGTAGIAPDSTMMPIQVLYFVRTGEYQGKDVGYVSGSTPEIVAGISRAVAEGADVVNLSLGPAWDESVIERWQTGDEATRKRMEEEIFIPRRNADLAAYRKALDLAKRYNVILVNAAGNDNIPAEFDAFSYSNRMISVAATDPNDQRASFSNYGGRTTVSAPGVEIHSAWSSGDDAYEALPGTSMASPHVAGVVALMRSIDDELTFEEARDILVATGVTLATDQPVGPLVNAAAAIKETRDRMESGDEPPADEPPMVTPPPADPKPPETTQPTPPPTPEEIVNGPAPWQNPQVQNLIDLWLSMATPPLEPVDGRPWFYDEWGRMLNNYTAWANMSPDHGAMTRHQWVWQFAKELDSVRHGTLYEFVLGMLRDGTFVPAPPGLPGTPGKPDPGNGQPGNDAPETEEPPKPGDSSPLETSDTAALAVTDLIGQWTGSNGEGTTMGLTFFDDATAWSIRDGVPTPLTPYFDLSELPAILELASSDGRVRQRMAVELLTTDELRISTTFNTSRPRFREGDTRNTYVLSRVDPSPGETDPLRYGFEPATHRLLSLERIVIAAASRKQPIAGAHTMPAAYSVKQFVMAGDGINGWVVMDNPYPAEGTDRQPMICHVDLSTGSVTPSALDLAEGSINTIRTTPDGQTCWAIVDYGIPAAVQPIREFRIMRASTGGPFTLIADTGDDETMGRFGLAQDYEPAALPGGESILFNDGMTIWRASSGGFQKILERDTVLDAAAVTPLGNNGFREFRVSQDGTRWVATMTVKDDDGRPRLLLSGDMGGGVDVLVKTTNYLYRPVISADGQTRGYFDATEYDTLLSDGGAFEALARVGKYQTHSPVLFNSGNGFYAVIGSYNSGNQVGGFIEDRQTGRRTISHGEMVIGSNPGRMRVSDSGSRLVTIQGEELGVIDFAPVASEGDVEEIRLRVSNDKLTARLKVAEADEVTQVQITYLYEGQAPSQAAMAWADNPFGSWANRASMRQIEDSDGWFEASTDMKLNAHDILTDSTFLISVKKKNQQAVNYIVTPQ